VETTHNGGSTYRLANGTVVRCRPVRAADRRKLLDAFEHFSPESRYRRFFAPTPRLTNTMLSRLLEIDGRDRVAIGAETLRLGFLPGPGLGIARFTRLADRPDAAELALSIVDEVQGNGLGTILLQELSAAARANGVARFVALVQPDNEPMKALLRKLDPAATSRVEDGVLLFELRVPGELRAPHGRRPRASFPLDASAWLDGLRQLLPARLAGARL
jgi:RimJ/RimL family protein N-acetyltransferase